MREKHLALIVYSQAEKYGDKTALRARSEGQWKEISYRSMGEQVRAVAKALLGMGVKEGDRVGIFSQNRPEWTLADFAIMSIRAVSVPIYATNTSRQAEYIVNDAEIGIIFVGGREQYDKIKTFFPGSPYLRRVIIFDDSVEIGGQEKAAYFREVLEEGRGSGKEGELEKRLEAVSEEDLATLIYTSGTTGEPKGVMLNHSNFIFSLLAHDDRLDTSERDVSMCFLPLSHVFERAWSCYAVSKGMTIVL